MTKKLLIIPGHGNADTGACAGGYKEAKLVRELAARIKAWGGTNVRRTAYGRDYYADNGITRLSSIRYSPKRWRIVELHMDSAGSTARGGHIVLDSRVSPDCCQKDMAKAIADMFPGRASNISMRDDLANPKRAYERGYKYELVECGFISNSRDRLYFINHMDDIAKAILVAHDIEPLEKPRKVKCPW